MSNKKRQVITLDVKKKIIEASATEKLTSFSKQFGFACSTIKTILNNKAAILSSLDGGGEAKRARMTKARHEDLEEAVLSWFKSA